MRLCRMQTCTTRLGQCRVDFESSVLRSDEFNANQLMTSQCPWCVSVWFVCIFTVGVRSVRDEGSGRVAFPMRRRPAKGLSPDQQRPFI